MDELHIHLHAPEIAGVLRDLLHSSHRMEAKMAQIDDDLAALTSAAGAVADAVTAGVNEIKALLANPGGPTPEQLQQIETVTTQLQQAAAAMTAAIPPPA